MLPVNLDEYSRYVTLDDAELRQLRVAEGVLLRLHRIRGMYAYWLQFPSKVDNDLVQYDMAMFKVSRSLAYEDLHLVKVLLGNLQQTTKEFMRWKINKSLEQDIAAARRAGDFRSVAALSKVLVNRDNNPDLLISITSAGVYNGKKDKRGEKLAETEEDKLEARTDGSDAFDVLCIGAETKPVFQGTGGTTNTYG